MQSSTFCICFIFQSTPSTRRETIIHCVKENIRCISIHSLHTEGDVSALAMVPAQSAFQSTPSTRRETRSIIYFRPRINYFNPLPPHGGRRNSSAAPISEAPISIHSLHTEGDYAGCSLRSDRCYFNPLPPHGGRRASSASLIAAMSFQSTPSTRRETLSDLPTIRGIAFQSTPSTRRETPCYGYCKFAVGTFQSTPSTRRETCHRLGTGSIKAFQSTPSTRRETRHSLISFIRNSYFNPLPPHGGRLRRRMR